MARRITAQINAVAPLEVAVEQTKLHEQYLSLNVGLWDWFRWAVAFKMSAASLDTIFLSLEPFKFLSRPAFIITAMVAVLGVAVALFYGYGLIVRRRGIKEKFGDSSVPEAVDARRLAGGVFLFIPST